MARDQQIAACSWKRIGVLAAVLFIVAICFGVFRPVLSYWFTGVDAFPMILSNRLDSASDIPKLFSREYLSAYAGEGSVGVRPVGMLLFTLDDWLWELNPFGYSLSEPTG